jgi:hypothetical protein
VGVLCRNLMPADERARTRCDAREQQVAIHWATSRSAEVSPENRAFAHDLIDAGADVILGHHPPHPKGVEVYRGKVILYAPEQRRSR